MPSFDFCPYWFYHQRTSLFHAKTPAHHFPLARLHYRLRSKVDTTAFRETFNQGLKRPDRHIGARQYCSHSSL